MKATDLMLDEAARLSAVSVPPLWPEKNIESHIRGFKAGAEWMAEQAKKDHALTKDDVWRIFDLVRELQTKYTSTDGCLQEVADIFNKEREKEIVL